MLQTTVLHLSHISSPCAFQKLCPAPETRSVMCMQVILIEPTGENVIPYGVNTSPTLVCSFLCAAPGPGLQANDCCPAQPWQTLAVELFLTYYVEYGSNTARRMLWICALLDTLSKKNLSNGTQQCAYAAVGRHMICYNSRRMLTSSGIWLVCRSASPLRCTWSGSRQ